MKDIVDNKLQELLEDKVSGSGSELSLQEMQDLKVYEKLVAILDSEPGPEVPPGFSATITGIIQKRKDRKYTILLYSLFGSLIIIAIFFIIFLINNDVVKQIAGLFTLYRGVILFSILVVILIHFADRRLVLKLRLSK